MLRTSLCAHTRLHAIAALSSVPEYLQRKRSRPLLDSPPVGPAIKPLTNTTPLTACSVAEEDDGAFDELLNCLQDSSDGSECSDIEVVGKTAPSRAPVLPRVPSPSPIIQHEPAVSGVSVPAAVARPVIAAAPAHAQARTRPAKPGKVVQKRRRTVPSTLSTLKLLASWADE
jgi:hypothetical protein